MGKVGGAEGCLVKINCLNLLRSGETQNLAFLRNVEVCFIAERAATLNFKP
jgi:hypothetical protein